MPSYMIFLWSIFCGPNHIGFKVVCIAGMVFNFLVTSYFHQTDVTVSSGKALVGRKDVKN